MRALLVPRSRLGFPFLRQPKSSGDDRSGLDSYLCSYAAATANPHHQIQNPPDTNGIAPPPILKPHLRNHYSWRRKKTKRAVIKRSCFQRLREQCRGREGHENVYSLFGFVDGFDQCSVRGLCQRVTFSHSRRFSVLPCCAGEHDPPRRATGTMHQCQDREREAALL